MATLITVDTHENQLDKVVQFLTVTVESVPTIIELVATLAAPEEKFTESAETMGIMPEDARLFKLEELVSKMRLDSIEGLVRSGKFGSGNQWELFSPAFEYFIEKSSLILEHCACMTPIPTDERKDLVKDFQLPLGNYIYGVYCICGFEAYASAKHSHEACEFGQAIKTAEANSDFNYEKEAAKFKTYANKYIPTNAMDEKYPKMWKEIWKASPEFHDELVEYRDVILRTDYIAWKLKAIEIDDDYIARLKYRKTDGGFFDKNTNAMNQIAGSLEPNDAATFYAIEPGLTVFHLQEILDTNKISKTVIHEATQNAKGVTSFFK